MTAHLDALRKLRARASAGAGAAWLVWAIEQAEASRHVLTLSQAELGQLAGAYGPGRVWVEGGQLRYQRETEQPTLLVPVTRTVFAAQADDPVRRSRPARCRD